MTDGKGGIGQSVWEIFTSQRRKRDPEYVLKSLDDSPQTPEELLVTSNVTLERLAEILPSDANSHPILPRLYYRTYAKDRYYATTSKGKLEIFLDRGHAWRYFTLYGTNQKQVDELIEEKLEMMKDETNIRLKISQKILKLLLERICDRFEISEAELKKVFMYGVRGSTVRGDSKEGDDIDLFIIFDGKYFMGTDELLLKETVMSIIKEVNEDSGLWISSRTIEKVTLLSDDQSDAENMLHVFYFTQVTPFFGENLCNEVIAFLKGHSDSYRRVKQMTIRAKRKMTVAEFIFQITRVPKTPKERDELRNDEKKKTLKELENIRKTLTKANVNFED
ncbi:MAG: nucleotidyltransferase domain-containing protein [archaeon]